jgi:hypothetical protein
MAPEPADEPIGQAVAVPVPVERAFAAFADLAGWWPASTPGPATPWRTSASSPARAATATSGAPTA